tara:strand:- start:15 stop:599 length:585 start_codon:yes stop_codon:yes gene_type:complete
MSLATLKKKTNAKYNNLSVGQGFSLNGVHRNQGYIGQTSLSRTIIGTPMKGNAPKGHGGCCGTYLNKIVKPALCLEKSEMVKRSVLSSNGMLRLKNKWLNGKSTVKPDVNQNNNIASMATVMKRRKAINELKQNDDCNPLVDASTTLLSFVEQIGSMEQNKYILKKTSECILNDPVQLQSSIDRRPLPSQTPKI